MAKLRTRLATREYSIITDDDTPTIEKKGNFVCIRVLAGKYRDKPYELALSLDECAKIAIVAGK